MKEKVPGGPILGRAVPVEIHVMYNPSPTLKLADGSTIYDQSGQLVSSPCIGEIRSGRVFAINPHPLGIKITDEGGKSPITHGLLLEAAMPKGNIARVLTRDRGINVTRFIQGRLYTSETLKDYNLL